MKVIAVSNVKGGCGKTSSAVNLAACLAEQKKNVLLIDLDSQQSASQWLGLPMDSRALFDVFSGDLPLKDAIVPNVTHKMDVIPGSRWMVGLDKALSSEIGAEMTLRRKIEQLPRNWDVIIIDCPPSTGIASLNALCAADYLLSPLEPTALNAGGLVHMIETFRQVQSRLNPKIKLLGIVPCRVDKRTKLAKEIIASLRERFGEDVVRSEIRDSVKMRECSSFGVPITAYDPKGGATSDYRALSKELLKKMENHEQLANR